MLRHAENACATRTHNVVLIVHSRPVYCYFLGDSGCQTYLSLALAENFYARIPSIPDRGVDFDEVDATARSYSETHPSARRYWLTTHQFLKPRYTPKLIQVGSWLLYSRGPTSVNLSVFHELIRCTSGQLFRKGGRPRSANNTGKSGGARGTPGGAVFAADQGDQGSRRACGRGTIC